MPFFVGFLFNCFLFDCHLYQGLPYSIATVGTCARCLCVAMRVMSADPDKEKKVEDFKQQVKSVQCALAQKDTGLALPHIRQQKKLLTLPELGHSQAVSERHYPMMGATQQMGKLLGSLLPGV